MDGEDRRILVIATVCCTRQAGKGQTAMEVEKLLKYIGTFQLFNIGTIWKYLIGFFSNGSPIIGNNCLRGTFHCHVSLPEDIPLNCLLCYYYYITFVYILL